MSDTTSNTKENNQKKSDPLTIEEMQEAADVFFPRFKIIKDQMPLGSTTEDTLKVMENVAKLGHQLRSERMEDERLGRFGFLKESNETSEL